MLNIIARLFIILGSLLIGFGIGVVVRWETDWENYSYWLMLCGALILGGFFLALGMMGGRKKKEIVLEKEEDEDGEEDDVNE